MSELEEVVSKAQAGYLVVAEAANRPAMTEQLDSLADIAKWVIDSYAYFLGTATMEDLSDTLTTCGAATVEFTAKEEGVVHLTVAHVRDGYTAVKTN